jgi:membrane-bound lytic murein transglycosylase D
MILVAIGLFWMLGIAHAFRVFGPGDTLRLNPPQKDDPVAAMLDSLDVLNYFKLQRSLSENQRGTLRSLPSDSVPVVSEAILRQRMAKLDAASPFPLEYHPDVKAYIDMYAMRKRGSVQRMLGMAELYFPMFEEKLARHKMPLELKYLAIIESALNPIAKSKAGASGLWQFMFGTGKLMGLEINSYVDERLDPEKATDAACRYLKYLHKLYDDWALALAAYNCGPGNVNKAIRRAGGKKTYWELRPFLPRETAGYVPAFIAANYVMTYHKEHNLHAVKPKYHWYEVDSVMVKRKVSFLQVSTFLGMPMEDLRMLNPSYILDVIPASEKGHPLYLPKLLLGDFMTNEPQIYQFLQTPQEPLKSDTAMTSHGYKMLEHVVSHGEYISQIAMKYRVLPDSIMSWNQLKSQSLHAGQQLRVYVPVESTLSAPEVTPRPQPSSSDIKYHTVRSGETLWAIAKKYGMGLEEIKRLNGLRSDRIAAGQKLKVKR